MNYPYVVAIPSFKREQTIIQKTLPLLLQYHINPSLIHIFVANQEQYDIYHEVLDPTSYGQLIIAVQGMGAVRNFMTSYFPEGQFIFYMDDDITNFFEIDLFQRKKPLNSLHDLIQEGFHECVSKGCRLFGIYPASNPYFMTLSTSFDLKYIIGCCYGIINTHQLQVTLDDKEDFERSIIMYLLDGGVVRINRVAPITKYYTEKGGMQEERTDERITESAKLLIAKYPHLARINNGKKSGKTELVLKDVRITKSFSKLTEPLQEVFHEEELNPDLEPYLSRLIEIIDKKPLKWNTHRIGSGEGITQAFGIINKRSAGLGEANNNHDYPELWLLLQEIAEKFVRVKWCGVQVNVNYQSQPHFDKNNRGDSWIVSFGDYLGGELCLKNPSCSPPEAGLKQPDHTLVVNTKYRPFIFNGSKTEHWNKSITEGTKYSIIYFDIQRMSRTSCVDIAKDNHGKLLSATSARNLIGANKEKPKTELPIIDDRTNSVIFQDNNPESLRNKLFPEPIEWLPLKLYGTLRQTENTISARINHVITKFHVRNYGSRELALQAANQHLILKSLPAKTNWYVIKDEDLYIDISVDNVGTEYLILEADKMEFVRGKVWRSRYNRAFTYNTEHKREYVEEILYPGMSIEYRNRNENGIIDMRKSNVIIHI
jgi:hypothetical protein